MSTLDFTHTGLQVVGKHTPEFSNETDANNNTVQIELPGTYQLGVLIEGVFVPFLSEKAGKILGIIERGKAAAPPPPPVPPADTPPAV